MKFGFSLFLLSSTAALVSAHGDHHEHGHHHREHHHEHHHAHEGHMRHHEHNHNEEFVNRPHTHVMFHHVESACAKDVATLCPDTPALDLTLGDPILDWFFSPSMSQAPPEILDVASMMDRLFDPLFLAPSKEHVTLFVVEDPQQAPQFLVDTMTAKVAKEQSTEEIPKLAQDLQKYGSQIMHKFEQDSFEHRMGRRLTEMDATTIQHHVHLPFGCSKNRCLRQAAMQGKVSQACQTSMQQLEATFHLEQQMEERQNAFLALMMVYMMTLVLLLVLVARRAKEAMDTQRLRARIMQAVYSNPLLKNKVEKEIGEPLGFVPPIPAVFLRQIGAGKEKFQREMEERGQVGRLRILFLVLLLIVAPCMVLPVCLGLAVVRLVRLCFCAPKMEEPECTCCCCGVSTTDVMNGNITEAQECCNCCKGTGVCSPSCASCCGGCCCCGGKDCCCCTTDDDDDVAVEPVKNGRGQKHVVNAKQEIYQGIPVQVV